MQFRAACAQRETSVRRGFRPRYRHRVPHPSPPPAMLSGVNVYSCRDCGVGVKALGLLAGISALCFPGAGLVGTVASNIDDVVAFR